MTMADARRPFRLAHISDLHIGPLPPVTPRDLLSKRFLGYLSWRTRKRRIHRIEVLAALARDLRASAPDHIVITGDLVNLGLPAEFIRAGAWLRELGTPEWISVVPGNHEAYVRIGRDRSLAHWADFMTSDVAAPPGRAVAGDFPYLRRRGPLAIIGLSTAVATPPGFATGLLGEEQLEALERLLAGLADEDCCRVLLLHHPPLEGACTWRKRLIDAPAFRRIVSYRGADLILHGHEHVPVNGMIEGCERRIPVRSVPSASSLDTRPQRRARYQIYVIERTASGWATSSEGRGYDLASASFVPLPAASWSSSSNSASAC